MNYHRETHSTMCYLPSEKRLNASIAGLWSKCNGYPSYVNFCRTVQILQLDEIDSKHEIPFDMNHNFTRSRRSYINIIGVAFNKAFGVSDAKYAENRRTNFRRHEE